jgi:hypothetical protein
MRSSALDPRSIDGIRSKLELGISGRAHVAISQAVWAELHTVGTGWRSASVSWRFGDSVSVTASAALTFIGGLAEGGAPIVATGFTGYVQDGQYKRIDSTDPWPIFFMDNVSQVDIELLAQNTFHTRAQAMALLWD